MTEHTQTPAATRTPDDVRNDPRPGDSALAFNGHVTYVVEVVDKYNVRTTAYDSVGELGEATVPRSDWPGGVWCATSVEFVPGGEG